MFVRVSYSDSPEFIPGPFTGIADGGSFSSGDQTAKSWNIALSETHTFSPRLVNEARIGDRKSTRLNSSHGYISYAVFCLKKKTGKQTRLLSDFPSEARGAFVHTR